MPCYSQEGIGSLDSAKETTTQESVKLTILSILRASVYAVSIFVVDFDE
jgi:hypothetical protein